MLTIMRKQGVLHIPMDGEYNGISENVVVYLNPKSKFKDSFSLAWSDGIMILTKMGLTGVQYTILFVIIAQMEYENYCYVTQSYIAKETGISQANVCRNIKVLVDRKLLFKESTKKGRALRVHSVIAWKGNKDKSFSNALSKDSEHELITL